ncbi:MAG: hypothetical protein ACFFBZ_07160 [Promethearchaeota archaeon]
MSIQFDYNSLEELSDGKGLDQIENVFNNLISEILDFLKLKPLYENIFLELIIEEKSKNGEYTQNLDFGVERIVQNEDLTIKVYQTYNKFLPFILLREAYYCFIPKESSKLVRICINQIVENDLSKLSYFKEWNNLMRDSLVNKDFLNLQLDKLKKFFKIKAKEPFENTIQFFFKEIRENILLSHDDSISRLYDLIFERYAYKTSKSLFNQEIIKTLRAIIYLFYKEKSYLNLSDYQNLFKKFKENQEITTDLSLRKFSENLQWINKCSSIAPSYNISFSAIDLCPIISLIKFNPLLGKDKVKALLEELPFYSTPKFSENSFATDITLFFYIPKIYLKSFLTYFNQLEKFGYIIKKTIHQLLTKKYYINLNYFTDISNIKKIIDPENNNFKKQYEIESLIEFPTISHSYPLSVFDFTILDRIRNFSITGLTFDKRIETLNAIKDDFENELRKQSAINKGFKDSLHKLIRYKQEFLKFLDENHTQGFLYLYSQLNHILNYLNLLVKILNNNPKIKNIYQLQSFLKKKPVFQIMEDQLLLKNKNIKNIVFHDFLPLYFQSIGSFRVQREKIQSFFEVLNACYNLKITDLFKIKRIVKELNTKGSNLAEEIYQEKEKRFDNITRSLSLYKVTNETVDSTIEAFLNNKPPLITPFLINTLITSTFAKYYPILILKDKPDVNEGIEKIKSYFPKLISYKVIDLITKRNLIHLSTYFLNIKEKQLFLLSLHNCFKNSIIIIKRYFWRGVVRVSKLQPKDFYDFEHKRYVYSEDYFKQLLIYSQKLFGKKLKSPKILSNNLNKFFWSESSKFDDLVASTKKWALRQDIDFDLVELDNLKEFKKNLEITLLSRSKFKDIKVNKFFERYIRSIKFLPAFQKFGFSQFHLFFRPFSYNEVDFKLLFKNTYQDLNYPACIEQSPAIFNKYIFPFRNANKSYLNWLIKSKKNISEFCLFYKKKFCEILNFSRNLTKEGWNYSAIRFKSYMQNVLFNPNYDPDISGIREFDLNEIPESNIYEPDSKEFKALTQIYNSHSIDIKSYLGTKKYTNINYIIDLLKKKLIFPYLSLKNLDFQEKISIILPNVKNEFNEKIIKIFNFFNMCHIYEIEGELYIYGFEDIKPFENGFLIEIWFPKCEMDEFFEVFDLIFQYFEIKHYLILTDLVDGKHLLKSVYGNLEFLDSYNPLRNLIWNDKDKIWMNHKLFNEKFEPIYPDLLYGEKKEN